MADESTRRRKGRKRGASTPNDDNAATKRPTRTAYDTLQKANMLALLKDGRYSDLTLRCEPGGETFKVHKSVLCPQSSFFEACVESGMRESIENVITLREELVDDVKRMLVFLYTGDFREDDTFKGPEDWGNPLPVNPPRRSDNCWCPTLSEYSDKEKTKDALIVCMRLYAMGDKFEIPGLRNTAIGKLELYAGDRLSEFSSTYGFQYGPEEYVRHVSKELVPVMDAVEFCFSQFEGQSWLYELADILLSPIAKIAPLWLDEGGATKDTFGYDFRLKLSRLLAKTQNETFQYLLDRISGNPQISSRLFALTCMKRLKEYRELQIDHRLCCRRSFRRDVQRALRIITVLLNDPEKIAALHCSYNADNAPEEGICHSEKPIVPVINGSPCKDTEPVENYVEFRCQDCDWSRSLNDIEEMLELQPVPGPTVPAPPGVMLDDFD
ncbi:hypothetical protein BJ508DRAFT_334905 [Ascobolus immersus RN42]|uniref:BTB domain-containing protein n=1 Tax=Ascobolus immersus RN42 TaxID=1160509 RepID=A0A3N4HEH9_ASCIM|nr:hypothetical protein BJ508DRAFT_334905 [Ascobolus immersus RN42]